ncbi:MAG: hypothetical protein IKO62_01390 [Bacteroidales bacterium]|nr:hypothetical protein [Bacteroidales bacterium]
MSFVILNASTPYISHRAEFSRKYLTVLYSEQVYIALAAICSMAVRALSSGQP